MIAFCMIGRCVVPGGCHPLIRPWTSLHNTLLDRHSFLYHTQRHSIFLNYLNT